MKVLSNDGSQHKWVVALACTGAGHGSGCGTRLLVDEDDIYRTHISCLGDLFFARTFTCPKCGIETNIDSDLIPPATWKKTDKTKHAQFNAA